MDNFWSMPIGSRVPMMQGELPGPVYRDAAGNTFQTFPQNRLEGLAERPQARNLLLDVLLPMGDWRNALAAVWDDISAPRRAMQGEIMTYGDAFGTALDAMGGGAFGSAPAGATRMFAGRTAKTADTAALARAEAMAAQGASRDDIWNQTGWFKGVDGQWRWEIDDSKVPPLDTRDALADLTANAADEGRAFNHHQDTTSLGGVLSHPDLFGAYPDMADMKAVLMPPEVLKKSGVNGAWGGYSGPADTVTLRSDLEGAPLALHEAQHAIQQREGFAGGGSPRKIPAKEYQEASAGLSTLYKESGYHRALRNWLDKNGGMKGTTVRQRDEFRDQYFAKQSEDVWNQYAGLTTRLSTAEDMARAQGIPVDRLYTLSSAEIYRDLAGEVEARNVQSRAAMTPEQRRATPPWQTQDVPDEQQIVRRR